MKMSAAQLAKVLGISRATIFNLKKAYPTLAPKAFDDVEKWRAFALAHLIGSDQTTRLSR